MGIETGPLDPFLLDIDVEGTELEILKSINWSIFTPRVIAIEEWKSPIYGGSVIRSFLESQNYKLTDRAVVTSIYIHAAYLESKSWDES